MSTQVEVVELVDQYRWWGDTLAVVGGEQPEVKWKGELRI